MKRNSAVLTTHLPGQLLRRFGLISAIVILTAGCIPGQQTGQSGVFEVQVDGSGVRQIASSPGAPVWSPGGDRLAWSTGAGLWIASGSGADAELAYQSGKAGKPAWDPAGNAIAVVDNAVGTLVILNLPDQTTIREPLIDANSASGLTQYAAVNTPSWASDGSALAFTAWDGSGDEIFAIDRDGNNRRQLSNIRTSDQSVDNNQDNAQRRAVSDAGRPAWQINSPTIAFGVYPETKSAPGGVYQVDEDGSNQGRITTLTPGFGPLWSPASDQLLVTSRSPDGSDLYVINPTSRTVLNLTETSELSPLDADWSPDGRQIAVSADGAIYVVDIASGELRQLVDGPLVDMSPAWSPDGETIAYQSVTDLFVQPALPLQPS